MAAGFRKDGHDAQGKLCLRLDPERWPPPIKPARDGLWREEMSV